MLWHPMHMAARASTDFAPPAGACCAPFWAAGAAVMRESEAAGTAAAAGAAGAWACAAAVAQATARAKSVGNRFFILGAESLNDYIGGPPSGFPLPSMKFQGSQNYVATQDLMLAV